MSWRPGMQVRMPSDAMMFAGLAGASCVLETSSIITLGLHTRLAIGPPVVTTIFMAGEVTGVKRSLLLRVSAGKGGEACRCLYLYRVRRRRRTFVFRCIHQPGQLPPI